MSSAAAGSGPSARVGVAVPGAGSGERMGGVRKPFVELCGEPALLHALRPFLADLRVVSVVVALAREEVADLPRWLTALAPRVRVVAGGETRSDSVRAAIAALPSNLDAIAVHDAARPLVRAKVVARCIDVALAGSGAVAGAPAVDTLKRVDPEGCVLETPDRASLWHAHTPQVFPAVVLREAYQDPTSVATDDASLVERSAPGLKIRLIDAGADNLKVTRPADISLAEAILAARGEHGR